jgi:hypothetical protein
VTFVLCFDLNSVQFLGYFFSNVGGLFAVHGGKPKLFKLLLRYLAIL